ncbi:MAG: hypothetical protein ABL903_10135 [Methylococcales bacterium]
MSDKTPITRIFEEVPKTAKRLWKLLLKPSIPIGPVADTPLNNACIDLFATAIAVPTIISVGNDLALGLFDITLDEIINWKLFALLLMLNAALFSLIIYILLLFPLRLKARNSHSSLFYHSLHFFAIQNIPISILFVSCLNQLIVEGSVVESAGVVNFGFTLTTSVAVLVLTIWLLAMPVSAYIKRYFRSISAYVLGFGAVALASAVNPVIASSYFSNIVNYKQFCSELVSARFKYEIESGQLSKDCIISKCLSAKGEEAFTL